MRNLIGQVKSTHRVSVEGSQLEIRILSTKALEDLSEYVKLAQEDESLNEVDKIMQINLHILQTAVVGAEELTLEEMKESFPASFIRQVVQKVFTENGVNPEAPASGNAA